MKEADRGMLCKLLRNPFVHSTAGLRGSEVQACKRIAHELEGTVPAGVQPPQQQPASQPVHEPAPAGPSDDTQPPGGE